MRNYNYFLFSILFFISCTSDIMTKRDLLAYVKDEDNNLKKTIKTFNGVNVEVFVLRRELLPTFEKKSQLINDSLAYFMVSFSNRGKEALSQVGNFDQYAQLINNLSFSAGDYCTLKSERDTLDMVNSYFLNTYGTSSANNVLMVYKKKNHQSDYELIVSDPGFGTGPMKFLFREKDIEKLNKIKVID